MAAASVVAMLRWSCVLVLLATACAEDPALGELAAEPTTWQASLFRWSGDPAGAAEVTAREVTVATSTIAFDSRDPTTPWPAEVAGAPFAARLWRVAYLEGGHVRLASTTDGALRLFVVPLEDAARVLPASLASLPAPRLGLASATLLPPTLDAWMDRANVAASPPVELDLASGYYLVVIEYASASGDAVLVVDPGLAAPCLADDWSLEYFANRDASGPPVARGCQGGPDLALRWTDLGDDLARSGEAPLVARPYGVPADGFSLRASRPFAAGSYTLHDWADDGLTVTTPGRVVTARGTPTPGVPDVGGVVQLEVAAPIVAVYRQETLSAYLHLDFEEDHGDGVATLVLDCPQPGASYYVHRNDGTNVWAPIGSLLGVSSADGAALTVAVPIASHFVTQGQAIGVDRGHDGHTWQVVRLAAGETGHLTVGACP